MSSLNSRRGWKYDTSDVLSAQHSEHHGNAGRRGRSAGVNILRSDTNGKLVSPLVPDSAPPRAVGSLCVPPCIVSASLSQFRSHLTDRICSKRLCKYTSMSNRTRWLTWWTSRETISQRLRHSLLKRRYRRLPRSDRLDQIRTFLRRRE